MLKNDVEKEKLKKNSYKKIRRNLVTVAVPEIIPVIPASLLSV